MLKELEQRQGEQSSGSSQAAATTQLQNKSSLKVTITIVIIVILLLNVIGLYIWELYTENETLKRGVTQSKPQNTKILKRSAPIINKAYENQKNEKVAGSHSEKILEEKKENDITQVEMNIQRSELIGMLDRDSVEQDNKKEIPVNSATSIEDQSKLAVSALQTNNTVATPTVKSIAKPIPETSDNSPYQPKRESVLNTGLVNQEVPKSSLSISRSKPSAESIVKKSLEKAERAILDNEIPKAEQLFEDILLIQPEHKGARKQLSALWFGRKLFQPALNLLSKGIELYPTDVDFRLMKARVLLSQNYNKEAFYVLNGYATAQHAQYQALLATTAESLGNVKSVILAYKQLVNIEEYKGKWWLGLAVALDRDSQFVEAKVAYETALSKGNLSSNSAQFVRQRMTELGE